MAKTATKQLVDRDSAVNQRIKGDFVAREVIALFSCEMDEILKAGLVQYEDIVNLYEYKCPDCGNGCQKIDDARKCCGSPDEPESEPQEIYEWWMVSNHLSKKLSEAGEPVLEWHSHYYWGRTCTGQVILLDSVISDICEEMEILDGQQYSWAK